MSAFVLVTGAIFRAPEPRTSKAGKPFVVATIRAKDGEASQWWKVLAFSESAQAELLCLGDGDAASVQGALAAVGVPVTMIAPPVWKRASNIAAGKENKDSARSAAISRWPSQAVLFARKCDCDRAEAALIGLAGLKRQVAQHD
jgi:hypothetical protein